MEPEIPEEASRPEPPSPPESRAHAQMDLIRQRFGDTAEEGPIDHRDDGVKYWVRRDLILVRDGFADRARDILYPPRRSSDDVPPAPEPPAESEEIPRPAPDYTPRDRRVVLGMQYVAVPSDLNAQQAVEYVNAEFHGVAATEKLLHITSTGSGCPATEPVPVPIGTPPDPPVTADRQAGEGVRVVVVDTGLDRPTAKLLPWMRGVRGDVDTGVRPDGTQDPYAGHGTFIAGVVRSMAPRARVLVRRGLPYDGCAWESDLIRALTKVLQDDHPDVISLSAGTLSNDRLALFEEFYRQVLSHYKGVAIVAAAGNDGKSRAFWPAAAPWTTSVGALSDDWRHRAWFTNHGGWVDVYAPGQNLVNAYPVGWFRYREKKHFQRKVVFDGMARWSGTSFATPLVAGLIAARMSKTGESGRVAAAALVHQARHQAISGVGAVLTP
ncbi:MAG TPA: S8/S53 family peptidase [Actinoplanes sp.]